MSRSKTLTVAYTPDSDDAFYYFALETGRLPLPGISLTFHREPMAALNRAARQGLYSITAISSVASLASADVRPRKASGAPRIAGRAPSRASSRNSAPG